MPAVCCDGSLRERGAHSATMPGGEHVAQTQAQRRVPGGRPPPPQRAVPADRALLLTAGADVPIRWRTPLPRSLPGRPAPASRCAPLLAVGCVRLVQGLRASVRQQRLRQRRGGGQCACHILQRGRGRLHRCVLGRLLIAVHAVHQAIRVGPPGACSRDRRQLFHGRNRPRHHCAPRAVFPAGTHTHTRARARACTHTQAPRHMRTHYA
jgi:hypothetical protein